jgi:feruloyl esterase
MKISRAFLALLLLSIARPLAAGTCENLASVNLPNMKVTSAATIAAGAFAPSVSPAATSGAAYSDLPAFCRVLGTIRTSEVSSIKFEVWMPAAKWNGNFRAEGFAYFGGTMDPAVLATALRDGYATATTDAGGDGTPSAVYLMGHPESLKDWNERAWHETTLKAKALILAYYGRAPRISYLNTTGGGTRQGLKEVALYPADYDALAAGGLTNYTTHFIFAQIWAWQATHETPASLITPAKAQILHRAVLNACDANDGVRDGIIQDPLRCKFDPGVLLCKNGDAADCLTAPQVEAARKLYSPVLNSRTKQQIYGPLMPGSELTWLSGVTSPLASPLASPNGFAPDFFKYLVFKNAGWDYRTRPINYDEDFDLANAPDLTALNAIEPNLKPFFDRGGKVFFYVGWADDISPLDSIAYYQSIVSNAGSKASAAIRLFMIPDMGHLLANGNIPYSKTSPPPNGYSFDPMQVLTEWKENGKAPERIIVSHRSSGAEDRRMLVCPYPQIPVYSGKGNVDDAANFSCKK